MKKIALTFSVLLILNLKLFATTFPVASSNFLFTPASISITTSDVIAFSNSAGFHFIEWLSAPGTLPANTVTLTSTPVDYTFATPGTYTYRCGVHNSMLGTITVTAALPIKLRFFDVAQKEENLLLKWATEIETNVSNFEIERASDNLKFSQIGKISAKGTSSETTNYEFEDNNLLKNTNFVYYRLKTIDNDSKFEYSPIIVAKIFSRLEMKVYPNPSSVIVMFEGGDHDFHHSENDISIYNSLGIKVMGPIPMHIHEGMGMFDIDVSNYNSGKYIAVIDNNVGVKKSLPFIVRH